MVMASTRQAPPSSSCSIVAMKPARETAVPLKSMPTDPNTTRRTGVLQCDGGPQLVLGVAGASQCQSATR